MASKPKPTEKLRVIIAGGGVAGLETALVLKDLAAEQTALTLLTPNDSFIYRPMAVREPFGLGQASRYALAPIARQLGAELLSDSLAWVDPQERTIHTEGGMAIAYDALVLAMGASPQARYPNALTIDDHRLDEVLQGVLQDIEGDYLHSIAFVSPGRMAWPMPLYELALMTAGRAYEMGIVLTTTIVTPEDSPLAIFGASASAAVAELLDQAGIQLIASSYAEVPHSTELVISPGDRRMHVDRVIALPELYGPGVRGVPLSEHGFVRVDAHGRVPNVEGVYAAGDATDFAIKHGGLASQQADAVAQSIAALAGAEVTPMPFDPVIHSILLTGHAPLYLTAHITGGHGFSSQSADEPSWSPPGKIAALYLGPFLDALDRASEDGSAARGAEAAHGREESGAATPAEATHSANAGR